MLVVIKEWKKGDETIIYKDITTNKEWSIEADVRRVSNELGITMEEAKETIVTVAQSLTSITILQK